MRWLAPTNEPPSALHVGVSVFAMLLLAWTTTAYARAPYSIAMIALGALCLVRLRWVGPVVRPWRGAPAAVARFFGTPAWSLLGALPLVYALSLLWTGDASYTLRFVRITLPLLGVAGAGYMLRDVLRPYTPHLWLALVVFAGVSAVGTIAYVCANHTALLTALGQGRAVPMPHAHVRSATVLALASLVAAYLTLQPRLGRSERLLAAACGVLCITALHLTGVRTGLVLFYIGASLVAVRLALTRLRSWPARVALVGVLIGGATVAYHTPTVQRKLSYARWDLDRVSTGEATDYSDAGRYWSYRAGWEAGKARPLLGAAAPGMRARVAEAYASLGKPDGTLLPTNQYMFSWLLAGVPGLLGVLAFFVAPLLERHWWQRPMLAESLVLIAVLCLVETPFASDVGVGLSGLVIVLAKLGGLETTRLGEDAKD